MRIIDSYNLENLVDDYGFIKNKAYDVYIYKIFNNDEISVECAILVNDAEHTDRKLRFYYYDELDNDKDIVDYAVEIPNILLKMIKDGIVEE